MEAVGGGSGRRRRRQARLPDSSRSAWHMARDCIIILQLVCIVESTRPRSIKGGAHP